VSGVFHDSHPLIFFVQIISPSSAVVRSAEITVPGNAPNPAATFIGLGFAGPPGIYQKVVTPNGEFESESFEAPDCSQ
jgi:Ni,Fe-hydrogenase III small subunit